MAATGHPEDSANPDPEREKKCSMGKLGAWGKSGVLNVKGPEFGMSPQVAVLDRQAPRHRWLIAQSQKRVF